MAPPGLSTFSWPSQFKTHDMAHILGWEHMAITAVARERGDLDSLAFLHFEMTAVNFLGEYPGEGLPRHSPHERISDEEEGA